MAKSALIVGIASYSKFRNLEKAVKDAGAIAEILAHHGHYAIEPLPRKLMPGDENRFELNPDPQVQVKYETLIDKLRNFLEHQAKGKDALIYFAGHGFVVEDAAGDKIGYFAAYDDLGGILGSLNKEADRLYNTLQPQEQEWAKRICLMLVRTGHEEKDTRQRRSKRELLGLVGEGDRQGFENALEMLVQGRLLATDKARNEAAAWVDIAHEALMEQWTRFAEWREEKREVIRLSNRISDFHKEWQHAEDQDKFLLSLGVVEQVEKAPALKEYLTLNQQEFVNRNIYYYKPWCDPKFFPELEAQMIELPAGKFSMGSPKEKGDDDEKPQHQVTLKAFRMGKY